MASKSMCTSASGLRPVSATSGSRCLSWSTTNLRPSGLARPTPDVEPMRSAVLRPFDGETSYLAQNVVPLTRVCPHLDHRLGGRQRPEQLRKYLLDHAGMRR